MTRQELLDILGTIQNTEYNMSRDIMTFADFMTTLEELRAYIFGHFCRLPDEDRARAFRRALAIAGR